MSYRKLNEDTGSPVQDLGSPVRHVWNTNLYQLQQEAPSPRPVACARQPPGCPPCYGREFHGTLAQREAAALLDQDGSFLVRRSSAADSDFYTLSLRFGGQVKHYKLYYDGQHYVKDKRFDSVRELVADGLVTLYIEEKAGAFVQQMPSVSSYEKSPYMTLNRLKRRAVIARSLRKSADDRPELSSTYSLLDAEREATQLPPAAAAAAAYDRPHNFRVHTFKGLNWCEFCGNFLWGFTAQGVKCEDCGFSAHSKCSEKVPCDCCPDLKQLRGVFGIDLTTLVKAHRSPRPFVVDKCVEEMERRGLEAEGLYRVSGFAEEIETLKMALDRDGEQTDMSPEVYDNINVIAGTLKLYLRLLPIPLITFDAHPALISAAQCKCVEDQKKGIRDALTLLPPAHLGTLKYLMEHLGRVAERHSVNKMTSHNLSTVFAPTLMPPPRDLSKCVGLPGMTYEICALETMISHQREVFS
ncbi:beta-chimaerin isoform X2 [Bacillus rossius redtenbacheri]|uniref:beta-chimaerin isoform X2 n=1 Tax=Bacillus rossius redtenbacheri TaxID=93214 RepID=UPI002FDDECFD